MLKNKVIKEYHHYSLMEYERDKLYDREKAWENNISNNELKDGE